MLDQYPNIKKAFRLIEADNGCDFNQDIPARWHGHLPLIDKVLWKMEMEKLETLNPEYDYDNNLDAFTAGEEGDQILVTEYYGLAGALANVFLNDFFEFWSNTVDSI